MAQCQQRLLVATACRLRRCGCVVGRSEGPLLQGYNEQQILDRLQGPDFIRQRRGQRGLRAGADVRFGCDRRRNARSRSRRGGAARQAIFPQVDLAFGSKTKRSVIASEAKQSSVRTKQDWIASSLRSSQ